jgi:hypothetical protein
MEATIADILSGISHWTINALTVLVDFQGSDNELPGPWQCINDDIHGKLHAKRCATVSFLFRHEGNIERLTRYAFGLISLWAIAVVLPLCSNHNIECIVFSALHCREKACSAAGNKPPARSAKSR